MEVLKVSTKSNPNSVAGALAAIIKEKNIVEIYYLTEKEDINNYNLNSNSDRILVLVKSLNEKNIEIIKKIESNYNIIVAIGEVNILNEKIKEEFNKLNNVIIINKLKKSNNYNK